MIKVYWLGVYTISPSFVGARGSIISFIRNFIQSAHKYPGEILVFLYLALYARLYLVRPLSNTVVPEP